MATGKGTGQWGLQGPQDQALVHGYTVTWAQHIPGYPVLAEAWVRWPVLTSSEEEMVPTGAPGRKVCLEYS